MACAAGRLCQSESVNTDAGDDELRAVAPAGLASRKLSRRVPAQSSRRKQGTGRMMLRGGSPKMRASRASRRRSRVESTGMGNPRIQAHQSTDVILRSTSLEYGRSSMMIERRATVIQTGNDATRYAMPSLTTSTAHQHSTCKIPGPACMAARNI